ncbi:hypothetical protein Tco_0313345 [Tanacetum coccineum]
MSTLEFAETHNLVAFLEKPEESNGFEGIIDFLNASSINYALTVNPIVYESCIQQFWAIAKAKTVNGECQIQALVDKKKLTLIGTMASAIICLATNQKNNFSKYIFDHMMKNLEGGVKFLMYPRFVQVFLDKQLEGMSKHKGIYVTPSHTKKIFANMKREGKGFFRENHTSISKLMMVHSSKRLWKNRRKDNGPTEPIPDEATNEKLISSLPVIHLKVVLDLEEAKTAQAKEIASLKMLGF